MSPPTARHLRERDGERNEGTLAYGVYDSVANSVPFSVHSMPGATFATVLFLVCAVCVELLKFLQASDTAVVHAEGVSHATESLRDCHHSPSTRGEHEVLHEWLIV